MCAKVRTSRAFLARCEPDPFTTETQRHRGTESGPGVPLGFVRLDDQATAPDDDIAMKGATIGGQSAKTVMPKTNSTPSDANSVG